MTVSLIAASCFFVGAVSATLVFIIRRRISYTPVQTLQSGVVLLAQDGQIVDETPAARRLLGESDHISWGWDQFIGAFANRFPSLPSKFDDALKASPADISSAIEGDAARLRLTAAKGRLRISLVPAELDETLVSQHHALQDQATLGTMTRALGNAPYPVWIQDEDGRESWRSPEYLRLRSKYLNDEIDWQKPLFKIEPDELRQHGKQRFMLPDTEAENGESWYEVSMSEDSGTLALFAVNITPLVRAEQAQRSFVQTLTKTFAQLGTGLAIFDRDRQLVLFNPALIELTQMSGEFLSARPTLISFFDWLREARVMPEPRNYADWRQQLTKLTEAAAQGTFAELWSLPNGLSYRVYGRPHPDGAIAFLFEDVTAELSLTRNFVNELEINHSLLDALPEAIAVFSSAGDILSVNKAYRELWGDDPSALVQPVNISLAIGHWAEQCHRSDRWDAINAALSNPTQSKTVSGKLNSTKYGELSYEVTPLSKGAVAIRFCPKASAEIPTEREGILA